MSSGSQDNESLAALQEAVSLSARIAQDASTRPPAAPYLIVRMGPRWLALPAMATREIILRSSVTRLPLMPPQVLGVALIHGRVVPVVTLEGALGTTDAAELVPTLPRLVVIETAEGEIALTMDEVHGITELASASLHQEMTRGSRPAWVAAELTWEERRLCIVDVQRLVEVSLGHE